MVEIGSDALDNFCAYLAPTIGSWGVVFDGAYHQAIVRGLGARLPGVTWLDLREGPGPIVAFAREHRHDEGVGVLEFLLNQPTFGLNYSPDLNRAIGEFDRWHAGKAKLCFEVWDGNFDALFAESPHEVSDRCIEMYARVIAQKRLSFSADPEGSESLDIACHDVTWITQTGFEDYDYILPTGEVCTCPNSLEGSVSLAGWLIGTLPFGAKYGAISRGDLVVRFSGGRIAAVTGTHRQLCADFETALTRLPTLQHASEVAVGMSRAIANAAKTHEAGHLWHERHLGFHIGLGARIPQTPHPDLLPTGPHLDLVFVHGLLRDADGERILAW